jgi:hypothetical protein
MKVLNHFVEQNGLMFLLLLVDVIELVQVLDAMEVVGEFVEVYLMLV